MRKVDKGFFVENLQVGEKGYRREIGGSCQTI